MTTLNDMLNKAKTQLGNSPIRSKSFSKFDQILNNFFPCANEISKNIEVIIESCSRPLSLVVMGELKSGKSSLINAVLEADVSPVDICEATSAIIDISYGKEKIGRILQNGATIFVGTPEAVHDILAGKNNDLQKLSKADEVKLIIDTMNIVNYHVVDTPGLETINQTNENLTEEFIQQSDVILWVFNANYLGQTDVIERLSKVAKYGKPIIGVINRTDEVEGDIPRLIDYVSTNYDLYLNKIHAVSSLMARESQIESDLTKLKRSGFPELMNNLKEIDLNVKMIHHDSIASSFKALMNKEDRLHEQLQSEVDYIKEQCNQFIAKIHYHTERINELLLDKVNRWESAEFLFKEEEVIINNIEIDPKNGFIQSRLNEISTPKYINSLLKNLFEDLSETFVSEWNHAIEDIRVSMLESEQIYLDYQRQYSTDFSEEGVSLADLFGEGAKTGAKIGGALGLIGGTLAIVSTAVTLPALIIIIPVYAAFGSLTGGIANLFSFGKKREGLKAKVRVFLQKMREDISNNYLNEVRKKIKIAGEKASDELLTKFLSNLKIASSYNDFEKFSSYIENYRDSLKNYQCFKIENK